MDNTVCKRIGAAFGLNLEAETYGNGHINDTYATHTEPRYIIQRINHHVFTDPVGVMDNFEAVTEHLRRKIAEQGGDPDRETLHLLHTSDGRNHVCVDGNYYRIYQMVEHTFCYDQAETAEQLQEAGRAFGHFQVMLQDFPAQKLKETIPHFHDTPDRYRKFEAAVQADAVGKAASCAAEIAFVCARAGELARVTDAMQAGTVPLRVTHNDTKINNILFDDRTGRALCVIDLDTVMPGSLLYDFGDAIRAGATTGAEDEQDLSKVHFSLPFYRAFREGFLSELGDTMTPTERELLPFSAKLMTLECGIRFLTDHLMGDTYFRIHRENHNLDRARTQFKLVADMENAMAEMAE